MLKNYSSTQWNEVYSDHHKNEAVNSLENGSLLYFPQLSFSLLADEVQFLSPEYADPHAKNISYHAKQHKLWGVQHLTDEQHVKLKNMLDRFAHQAFQLIQSLLPHYAAHLIVGRTSFRPVEISDRKTSFRKDDKRLHVDAFPSAPNQGKRILRVFCNINPHREARVWRIGEPFATVADKFLRHIKPPFLGKAAALRFFKITKSYRTLYDHYMLKIHDFMKANENYQKEVKQQEIDFAAQSTWIVQTDHVSHAVVRGQYALEQTFYLPVNAMKNEALSPLRILEEKLSRRLV